MDPDQSPKDALRKSWWTREAGGRDLFQIALPLIISTGSWSLMNFTDRMMLFWHSSAEIAAAFPAGILYFTFLCLPIGIAGFLNTFVAQYDGAGQPGRIGSVVWQGIWLGILSIPLFLATTPLASLIFSAANHDPIIAQHEVVYYRTLTFGAGGAIIACALSTFFTGRGNNLPIMQVNIFAALLNVVLDYLFIFGHWGFPDSGIAGAGWATVISIWMKGIIYFVLFLMASHRAQFNTLRGWKIDRPLLKRILRFGGPSGLHFFIEILAFAIFILLVGNLGELAMTASNLAFSINGLSFIPLLGMGLGVSTLVGRELGRNRPDLAARAASTALVVSLGYMGMVIFFYVATPRLFLLLHGAGVKRGDFEEVQNLVIVLLRFMAVYGLFDVLNIIFVGVLKGAGDTRFILLTHLVITPCTVFLLLLDIYDFQGGIFWYWTVLTLWVIALGLIFALRFLQGKWRAMRVIELDLLAPADSQNALSLSTQEAKIPSPENRPTSMRP